MRISIELNQSWKTAIELRCYLGKLARTIQRLEEMGGECPTDWYLAVFDDEEKSTHNVFLTHLQVMSNKEK